MSGGVASRAKHSCIASTNDSKPEHKSLSSVDLIGSSGSLLQVNRHNPGFNIRSGTAVSKEKEGFRFYE
jgi:hypothetical protein